MDLLKAITAQWNPFSNQGAAAGDDTFTIGVCFVSLTWNAVFVPKHTQRNNPNKTQ